MISSWDVRASSVVFGFHSAVGNNVRFRDLSAGANFSSSGGLLSAQMSLHYLTFQEGDADAPLAEGGSIGITALLHLPFEARPSGELPTTALDIYVGGMPTGLVGGTRGYLSLPIALGAGLPWSPSSYLSVTPWFELSRSLNLDPRLQAINTSDAVDSAADGQLTREEVEQLVEEGLDLRVTDKSSTRLGINVSVHLTPRVDFNADLLWGMGGPSAVGLGGSLVFRWDAFVPILNNEARHESSPSSGLVRAASPPSNPPPRRRRTVQPRRRPAAPRFRQIPSTSPPSTKGPRTQSTSPVSPLPNGGKKSAPNRRRQRLRVIPRQ